MSPAYRAVENFLSSRHQSSQSVVIALSGGADSLALFRLLLEYRARHGLALHALHVDHQWRKTSADEARGVQAMCYQHDVPCHLFTLPPPPENNREEVGRLGRLECYRQVVQQLNAQAILLAHHADDRAETILKSTLEGKTLTSLSGMAPVATVEGVALWRPLLAFSKQELGKAGQPWLMNPITDASNSDSRYLRPRLRGEVSQVLSDAFGKQVRGPLLRLGDEAASLRDYLDEQIAPRLNQCSFGPWGAIVPFEAAIHSVELRHLLRSVGIRLGHALDTNFLDRVVDGIGRGEVNGKVVHGRLEAVVDRGQLFLLTNSAQGEWVVNWQEGEGRSSLCDWRDVWRGQVQVTLPEADYQLVSPFEVASPAGVRSLGRWWNTHRVPAVLRNRIPVVARDGVAVHEFLSGRKLPAVLPKGESQSLITLSWTNNASATNQPERCQLT